MSVPEKIPIAVYGRVSSDQQRAEHTIGRQIELGQEALRHNERFELVSREPGAKAKDPTQAFFLDDGYNLEVWDENSRLAEIFELAAEGKIEAIWVSEVNRILRSRSQELRGKILDLLDRYELRVFEKSTEISRGLLMSLLGMMGAEEKKALGSKLHDGKKFWTAREGRPPSGRTPFGYKYEKYDRAWQVVPDESQALRWMASLATGVKALDLLPSLAIEVEQNPGGLPSYKIAKHLNQTGLNLLGYYRRSGLRKLLHKNPEGKFTQDAVDNYLKRELYATGKLRYQFKDTYEVGRSFASRKVREPKIIEINVPKIFETEVYERLRSSRFGRTIKADRNLKHQYLLKGMFRCSECGAVMSTRNKRNTYDRKRDMRRVLATPISYYICARKVHVDGKRCSHTNYHNATVIEPIVWGKTKEVLLNPSMLQALTLSADDSDPKTIVQLEQEILAVDAILDGMEEEKKRNKTLYVKGRQSEEEFDEENSRIAQEIRQANRRKGRLVAEKKKIEESRSDEQAVDVRGLAEKYASRLEQLGFGERQYLVQALFQKISVGADGVLGFVVRV